MSDLISRQAVLDYPIRLDHYDEEHGNRHFILGIESVMEYVEYLPSADRPTGKWVRLEREENVYDLHGVPTWGVNYMCDKCGFITTAIQDHFEQYKFCPHCGKRLVIER